MIRTSSIRRDFRRSLGPPLEETAGHVSGLSRLWRKFKILIYASLPNIGNGECN